MGAEPFSLISQPQPPGHCGPTSLSSCLAVLGIRAGPRELARAAGKPMRVFSEGLDELDIRRAAAQYGVRTEFLARFQRDQGRAFARRLRSHARQGLPAILLVDDFSHWVALVGFLEGPGRFLVMDPEDEAHAFNRWSETTLLRRTWCADTTGSEPSQYFAILTRRKDGRKPRWRLTDAFVRLCTMGSEQTAEEMANDLVEMARRACGKNGEGRDEGGPFLSEVLVRHARTVLRSVEHWAAYNRRAVRPGSLRSLYRDYVTVAAAAGIRLPAAADPSALVAQMTAVLTTYAWTGSL